MSPLLNPSSDSGDGLPGITEGETPDRGRSHAPENIAVPERDSDSSTSPVRKTPTSADIDAVIAAAMASAPPPPAQMDLMRDGLHRSTTPLMTNLLPAAVGADGRVNLFVGNLPYRVRWQDLKDLFRKAGTVLRADVSLGPDNRSRGYGTVLMGSREDGARAIDRFNGYTWQTRTLEVRPDRLPPEYEAQSHASHPPVRPPPFGYMPGGPPFPMSGQPNIGGVPWPGAPSGARPPMGYPGPPGGHPFNVMPNMGYAGSPPLSGNPTSSSSPQSSYGPSGMPLPQQNYSIAASPLAGSLTTGSPVSVEQRTLSRDITSHFAPGLQSQNSGSNIPRSVSPNEFSGLEGSRPASSNGRRNSKPSPTKPEGLSDHHAHSNRAPPPGHLGPLPPSVFAGIKAVPGENRRSVDLGNGIPGPQFGGLPAQSQPQPLGMAPLAPGTDLGEPSTLRDRIVFVSNLPPLMQWQELRDLLRPAGSIIRADVATGPDGRPRGFGTVLFVSETDAALAVAMFNEREVGGQRIRVHLDLNRPQNAARAEPPANTGLRLRDPSWAQPNARARHPSDPVSLGSFSNISSGSNSPIPSRLPWPLNTADNGNGNSTPLRQFSNGSNGGEQERTGRHAHHPGPISMPPFPNLNGNNPLSPLQTRGLPPMTPSMPGFVFHAYPATPPINAHYLSPGLDPFSPGAPVTSPGMFSYNPFLNPAPGAPVNRTPQGGSAALDTPTTQTFPGNPVHGYGNSAGPPGGAIPSQSSNGEYFPVTSSGNNAASPLNGKVRLASNGSETKLEDLTRVLSLSDKGRSPSPTKPSEIGRPISNGMKKSTSGSEISDMKNGSVIGGSNGKNDSISPPSVGFLGRASLDNPRPSLGVWGNGLFGTSNGNGVHNIGGDRRASWGAGRD